MKRVASVLAVVAVLALGLYVFSSIAQADEIKMVGVITKLEVAGDGKSATVTLKDNKSGGLTVVDVIDDLTLDKFKDHRIVVGDEIRYKYEVVNGRNESKHF